MFRILILATLVILGIAQGIAHRSVDKICKDAPIELGIVLDASTSIGRANFKTGKQFLIDFLNLFDIGSGPNDVHVALVTYGRGVYKQDGFNLHKYNSNAEVEAAISKTYYRGGTMTATGSGIKYMHEHFMARGKVRSTAKKVIIVITDGNSQRKGLTASEASAARNDGIAMFAVGVGPEVKIGHAELINIAGEASRITRVIDYNSLQEIKEQLAKQTCVKEDPCGGPTDVNFVYSPGDVGEQSVNWISDVILNLLAEKDLQKGFQFGLVTGPEKPGFNLNKYTNNGDVNNEVKEYDNLRLPALIKQMKDVSFSASRGGRVGAKKVAFLFATDATGIQAQLADIDPTGIKVFITDPTGNEIQVTGAVYLPGTDPKSSATLLASILCSKVLV